MPFSSPNQRCQGTYNMLLLLCCWCYFRLLH